MLVAQIVRCIGVYWSTVISFSNTEPSVIDMENMFKLSEEEQEEHF